MGRRNGIGLIVFALAIIATPWVFSASFFKLIPIGIYAFAAIGLSLLLGYAGQISLGHAAFYAIGAYTSGILTVRFGISPWMAIGAGVLLSAVVAFLVGMPSLRLHGHYLAMATLAFGEIVRVVLDAWDHITGGPSGFGGIPSLSIVWLGRDAETGEFGITKFVFDPIMDELSIFYLVWGVAFFGLCFALCLINSRIGRALRAIHSNEKAANVLGVPAGNYKIKIFVLSAAFASIAGSLYAHYVQYLNPPPFGVWTSILLVLMVIVGGMRNVWGAIIGAVLMGMLPEWISWMENYWLVVYGGILLLVMMFIPQGVLLGCRDFIRWIFGFMRKSQSEVSS